MSDFIDVCDVKNYVAIDDLEFHPDNHELRSITANSLECLKTSLVEKGFYEPIVITKENVILSGNQRVRAALELIDDGWTIGTKKRPNKIPVVILDVDDERAKEILIGSNVHHGDWIEEALAEAMTTFKNPMLVGFSHEELDRLMAIAEKEVIDAQRDDLSEVGDISDAPEKATPVEPMDSLTLPQSTMKNLKGILGKIAKSLNTDWTRKDSYAYATQVLCQAINESGLLEEIKEKLE